MKVTILGTGAYGIALSSMFLKNNCEITMWTKFEEEYQDLITKRCNQKVLPNYHIDKRIKFTMNMKDAIKNAEIIVIAIPIQYIKDTIIEVKKYFNKNSHICIASKGILNDGQNLPHKIVRKILHTKNISIISGPTFAIDMVNNALMGLVVASKNTKTNELIKKCLANDTLIVEVSNDIDGIELCGAIKNIMAISCGIIDGMNYPESTKCMLFTRCFHEMINLIYSLGGNKASALTYAGIGDLLLTCTSYKSRNYTFGKLLGSHSDKTTDYVNNTTIEGRYTLKVLYDILKKKKIKHQIINTMYAIVYKNADPNLLIEYLKK